ncbi:aspartyl protease family protein [Methylacidimicrobium sp. B4]|uniref:aspartyl protease family protein n=1 Tax=Methylacidimicrobium sp. B4 TaxID=2796139 RepID=UPI001A8EBBE8|nr:aspartyl protease family protein [Methylacidimicrobium sp. B4]QSR85660.1 aspartyl protease family protein [Methylacidimicrobium sp. B4]
MGRSTGWKAALRLSGLILLLSLARGAALPWSAHALDLLAQARQQVAEGNLEEAARLARKEAVVHPEEGESWKLLGAVALQRGDWPQAERALERALRVRGRDPEAASLLAVLWRREGRFRDAADLLRLLGGEAEADQLAGFGREAPFLQRGPDEIQLDWVGSGLRPVVPVLVGGKRWANFLVDTGASCVVLDRRLAEEIRLPPAGSAQLIGAGARSASGKLGRLDSLRFGATEVRNIPVVVVDLRQPERVGESFDGILGSEFLQHFVVTLDYPRRRLSLQKAERSGTGRSAPASAGVRAAEVPLRLTPGGLLVVPMEVASRERLLVFLDTGAAETALALSRRAARRLGLTPSSRGDRYFGVGGRYLASPILLPEVRFAGFSAHHLSGVIAPFPQRIEQGEGLPLGGFLGSGFCRRFRVTIDFSRMRVRLAMPERET